MANNAGLTLVKPASISYTGTSATVGANGKITFTAVTALSINGIFSSQFDDYLFVIGHVNVGTSAAGVILRMRSAGVDDTGSNYTQQGLMISGTSYGGSRSTTTFGIAAMSSNVHRSGDHLYVYGPYLAQPTATRTVNVRGEDNARLDDYACTHSLSTSYDGCTMGIGVPWTGALTIYGLSQ